MKKVISLKFISENLLKNYGLLLFALITILGLFLRFYMVEKTVPFGWDQGRDAWQVRDILMGKIVLNGPRTGIGNFYLGPFYYYLLAPFFFFSNLNPSAENYLNFVLNLLNFVAIYWVVKKLYSTKPALVVLLMYGVSKYYVELNRIPWNVSILPAFAILIFYFLVKVLEGKNKYLIPIGLLAGLLFSVHFTAVILIVAIPITLIFFKEKRQLIIPAFIALLIFILMLIPNILYDFLSYHDDYYKIRFFLHYEFIGFHLKFLIYRLGDILIQYNAFLWPKFLSFLKYLILPIFIFSGLLLDKDRKYKTIALVCTVWFAATAFIFTIYGGPISDYYFLITLPVVIMSIGYFLQKANNGVFVIFTIYALIFSALNVSNVLNSQADNSLFAQKQDVIRQIKLGLKIDYIEGDIKSYLYTVWVNDKKNFK